MRRGLIAIVFCLLNLAQAQAAPLVKVITFTADWCQSCRLLNPRLNEAIKAAPLGEIDRVDLDLTALRTDPSPDARDLLRKKIWQIAGRHKASYLVDRFKDTTGIAIAIAADTGEPLSCFDSRHSEAFIQKRLRLATILAANGKPGTRQPIGTSCPAALSS